jgi:GAF domain-containing protein
LLKTFADQAVIAIENTRLFEEVQAQTRNLSIALQRQTATSEILGIISASPGQLEPVFNAILERARELCAARYGHLLLLDGQVLRAAALHNVPPAYADFWRNASPAALRVTLLSRLLETKQPYQVEDLRLSEAYRMRVPLTTATVELAGARTLLGVPLVKDDLVIGAIVLYRTEVHPFDERQIALLSSFTDQAVIAIENTRLFEAEQASKRELQTRTRELQESLEQQTAISEILRVISSSPTDIQPVLDSVAERAARICDARIADIFFTEDQKIHVAATFGDLGRPVGEPVQLNRTTVMGRSIVDKRPIHVADLQNAGEEFPLGRELAIRFGHRTILAVPLVRDDRALGTILVRRAEVRPFEEQHVGLLMTFADQAAIAIENVRLFNEIVEKSRELEIASQRWAPLSAGAMEIVIFSARVSSPLASRP